MTLGQKIKEARIERKMTQRDVVGDYITRNMLSKIENDSATPSVKTLEYIARALNLPAGYFMSDLTTENGEPTGIIGARQAYRAGNFTEALEMTDAVDITRTSHEDEACLLRAKCCLGIAEQMYHEGDMEKAKASAKEALMHNAAGLYYDFHCELRCCQILMLCAIQTGSAQEFSQYEKRYLAERSKECLSESYAVIRAMYISENDGLVTGARSLDDKVMESVDNPWVRAAFLLVKAKGKIDQGETGDAVAMLEQAEKEIKIDGDKVLRGEIYSCLELCHKKTDNFKMAYHYATLRLEM